MAHRYESSDHKNQALQRFWRDPNKPKKTLAYWIILYILISLLFLVLSGMYNYHWQLQRLKG